MTTRSLKHFYKNLFPTLKAQRRAFWLLFFILGILGGLYIYFLSVSVMNVVIREEIEYDITRMETRISELEPAYLQKKNTIDLALARKLGFTEIAHKTYIARKPLRDRLTLYEQ